MSDKNEEVDLEKYAFSELVKELPPKISSIDDLDKTDIVSLSSVGVLMEGNRRSGTYLLYDHCAFTLGKLIEGFECLPIAVALDKYPWVKKKYWFKELNKDYDKYTSAVAFTAPKGYFIHVKKGVKIDFPFQAGLFMSQENGAIGIHNIVVLEENVTSHNRLH